MLRASAVAEEAGFPTSSLCCEGFLEQARTTAAGLAYPNLRVACVPGHVDIQTPEELRENILKVTFDAVVANLTGEAGAAAPVKEPEPREIVCEGTFEEVNRLFLANGWSDGLPVVPPTLEKISEFLAFTDRDPAEVLGILLPDSRRATIWSVAVNGVMAGCRPEYMPILVALVEAMADRRYGVEHSGNTPGAETLIVLDGPIVKELGFNYQQGVLRDGFQPNTSVGRFWRLYLRNVAGFHLHQTDKGTFGGTWRVVLAENEDALQRIGWPSIGAEMGCAPGRSSVTVSRYTGGNVIVSVFGDTAEKCLPYLADALVTHTTWEVVFTVGIAAGTYRPLLVLSPLIAGTIAKSGMSKRDVQQWLYAHARMPARRFENYMSGWTNLVPGRRSLFDLAKLGKAPKAFGESNAPERLVPLVLKPEDIMIAVSGDPLRSNCYVFPHNGMLGYPTMKPVQVPARWPELLARSQS